MKQTLSYTKNGITIERPLHPDRKIIRIPEDINQELLDFCNRVIDGDSIYSATKEIKAKFNEMGIDKGCLVKCIKDGLNEYVTCITCGKPINNNLKRGDYSLICGNECKSNEYSSITSKRCKDSLDIKYGATKKSVEEVGRPLHPNRTVIRIPEDIPVEILNWCKDRDKVNGIPRSIAKQCSSLGVTTSMVKFCINNDIEEYPTCVECGSLINKSSRPDRMDPPLTCSKECSNSKIAWEYKSKKTKNTNNIVYGGNAPSSCDKIKLKSIETVKTKYNVEHVLKLPEMVDRVQESKRINRSKKLNDILKQKSNYEVLSTEDVIQDYSKPCKYRCNIHDIEFEHMSRQIQAINSTPSGTLIECPKCREDINNKISSLENTVVQWIKEINPEIEIHRNRRDLLGNRQEVDLFLPEFNIGIEINGNYWHSNAHLDRFVNKKKNLNKQLLANENGFDLFFLWEHEINGSEDIVKSYLRNKLGNNIRIYARKTELREISREEYREFTQKYHFAAGDKGLIRLGLFHEGELLMVNSYNRGRFSEENAQGWELMRSVTKSGHTVVGGFDKLNKHFMKFFSEGKDLHSFTDAEKFNGKSYLSTGWELVSRTAPTYQYWNPRQPLLVKDRQQHQKHKLIDAFGEENVDMSLTETEICANNGWYQLYDCGNFKFKYNYKK